MVSGHDGLSRNAEECHHRSLDPDDLLRCQPAESGLDVRPLDGCELVDHQVPVVIKSGSPAGSAGYADPHQRRIQQRAGHGATVTELVASDVEHRPPPKPPTARKSPKARTQAL
ncbi:hypothetical protein [Mycobacterium asiaticum]|uniref:hypothetical protein n=1 Tax=Mycobacterium asiaticum TaxID=1790 RepID=UPI0007FD681D|nr:hypothetical protein [Mycobacterium asiaticum]OBJ51816.1 hypothetical protein A9W94_02345 [Mycobacterium asiaticum]